MSWSSSWSTFFSDLNAWYMRATEPQNWYLNNLVQTVYHQQNIYFKNRFSLTRKDDSEDGDDDGLKASVTRVDGRDSWGESDGAGSLQWKELPHSRYYIKHSIFAIFLANLKIAIELDFRLQTWKGGLWFRINSRRRYCEQPPALSSCPNKGDLFKLMMMVMRMIIATDYDVLRLVMMKVMS